MENHTHTHNHKEEQSKAKLAFSATLHCLLGCGIGEVVGIINRYRFADD